MGVVVTIALYLLVSPLIDGAFALVAFAVSAAVFVVALALWAGRRSHN